MWHIVLVITSAKCLPARTTQNKQRGTLTLQCNHMRRCHIYAYMFVYIIYDQVSKKSTLRKHAIRYYLLQHTRTHTHRTMHESLASGG